MKRLLKSWVFWVFVAVPAAGAVARFTYRHAQVRVCSRCFTEKEETQWRLGVEGTRSVPLLPLREETRETRVHLDDWAGPHEHAWGWTFTGPGRIELYGVFPGRISDHTAGLLETYEQDAAFRAFLLERRGRGALTREDFLDTLDRPFTLSSASTFVAERRRARFQDWYDDYARRSPFP